jgi:hypothetical protein
MMKTPRALFLLGIALFAVSCSKDDDAKPSLEEATLSLTSNNQVITAPAAMASSEDPYAQMAAGYVGIANSMSAYLSYFNKPNGAVKSTTKITAANGRTAEAGDVIVYTWTDANSGTSIAYQISEESDRYVFEIFYKGSGQSDWLKYFQAEEKKDKSSGFMKVYDIFGITGDDASVALVDYEWTRVGDILNFTVTDYSGAIKVELVINTKTKAGSVVYTFDGVKAYSMIWESNGNGSWAFYDEQGNVSESGTWTV